MQSSKNIRTIGTRKIARRIAQLWVLAVITTTALSAQGAQRKFSDRLLLDVVGQALVPSDQPTGLGGGLGFGYEFRDFTLFLKGAGMIAEPGNNQRTIINPTLRVEVRVGLLPSLLTLLPYVDVGSISTRIRLPEGRGDSGNVNSLYAATGVGAEILLSHELSLIPRIGVAYALLYSGNDSNNFSGPTVEIAMRYTFGRNRGLDY
jgi:hypothetical protein